MSTGRNMSKSREFVANSLAGLQGDAATAYALVLITMDSLNPGESITRRKAADTTAVCGEQMSCCTVSNLAQVLNHQGLRFKA